MSKIGWISVTEKEPPTNQELLLWCSNENNWFIGWVGVWSNGRKTWVLQNRDLNNEDVNITHYQLLSKPG